jgi:hypothetical protein
MCYPWGQLPRVRKSGDAVRVREAETLIDLGADPQLGTLPQPYAGDDPGRRLD